MTLSNEKLLELLANLVGKYLSDNGGYSNQYDTYVRGTIVPNKLGGITEFRTPGCDGKSKEYIKSIADGLEKEIKKLLHLYESETTIILDAEYFQEGVYFQKVSVLQTKVVAIPQAIKPATMVIMDEDRSRRQRQEDDSTAMSTIFSG